MVWYGMVWWWWQGLHGDKLPAMAMNTNDGRILTCHSDS